MKYIGLYIALFGFILRAVACYQLNVNFDWRIARPVYLVKNGIYRFIRNPMYLGSLFLFGGLILLSTNNILLTISLVYFMVGFYSDRIDREEQVLFSMFGNEFIEYRNKTGMLIPFFGKGRTKR